MLLPRVAHLLKHIQTILLLDLALRRNEQVLPSPAALHELVVGNSISYA